MGEVVHIALEGDVVAKCAAPIERSTPRAAAPEQATCDKCIDAYIRAWTAVRGGPPPVTPPMPLHPPSRQRTNWWYALVLCGVVLAALYWIGSGDRGKESGNIAVTVVDCSQTQLYQPEGELGMLPARVAQIQFVNNGDTEETFSAQVDGLALVGQDGSPSRYTLAPHGSQLISFSMNPKTYGNSVGACFALNVRAAQ
ncbi:hypothetical protein ACFTWS_40185 [Streptomyces sp. NPDC057027]|uniref:hypothetical protein n=1 Tax=Streptomyces sp. NPDC057027 TaxID=3346004 RepID=UPI00362E04BE